MRHPTYGEFAGAEKAHSKRSVIRLFDARGRRIHTSSYRGMKSQVREWKPCHGDRRIGSVVVHFDDYTYGSTRRGGPMETTLKDMTVTW